MVQLVGTTSLGLGKLIDGKNQFVHIRYSAHSNGSNMTTEIQADTKYIGIATNSSETAPTSPSDYSWGRFVGTSGTSSYTWIRYSSNEDGSNMTTTANEETKYIGVAITSENSAPADHTQYSWALFKGSDGRGVKKTEVSYQKSTSGTVIPTGTWLASIPSLNDGEYLWTRTLFTYTDGTTTSTYNVSRNGTSGLGVARTDVHYQKSTSGTTAPTGTWTVTIPAVGANEYLWTRTTITYTDDSSTVSYSVGKMGADGKDAQLLYLTATSEIQAFDSDDKPKTTEAIIISAKLQNASGAATFVAIPYIGNTAQPTITLGGTGNDRTLLPSQWTDTKWTSVAITATLGSLTDTVSIHKVKDGEKGEDGADGLPGQDGVGIESTTITYAASTSGTVQPTSGWSATIPSVPSGQYLWTKTTWTYTNGIIETSYSVSKIGERGPQGLKGDQGKDGVAGKDGVGVRSTVITYGLSDSETSQPASWSAQVPTLTKGKYLWTKTVWSYTDSTSETSYQKTYIARDGNDGTDGLPGKDGVGIRSTTITYAVSESGTAKPVGGWSTTVPTVPSGQYLWTRTVWTYTDDTSETGYSVAKMGERGPQGPQGLQGIQGPKGDQGIAGRPGADGLTSYTHIAYANSADGTKDFSVSDSNRTYIGVYVDFNATDSTSPGSYQWSLIKGADGADGTPGKPGVDGRTPYFHTAYANSADGSSGFSTTDSDGKLYLGTCTDYNQNDPTDYRAYTWVKIKGETGRGVKSYAITYQAGTSGTTVPTGTWTTTIPSVPQGQYLWTKMVITYTDNTSSTSYSVSYIPSNGATGATGNGVSSIITEFYLSTSKTTQTGGAWSTTQPTWSPGKYVWTRNKITYTNGSTAYTSPQCSSEWEAVNNIQVGGRNLFIDAGFKKEVRIDSSYETGHWFSYVGSKFDYPKFDDDCNYLYFTASNDNGKGIMQFFDTNKLVKGETYSVRTQVKVDANTTFRYQLTKKNPDNSYNWYFNFSDTTITTIGEWVDVKWTFTIPKDDDAMRYGVAIRNLQTGTETALRMMKPKLEVGNMFTGFSFAPEDTQAQIDQANDNISNKVDQDAYDQDKSVIYEDINKKLDDEEFREFQKIMNELKGSYDSFVGEGGRYEQELKNSLEREQAIVKDFGDKVNQLNFINTYIRESEEGLVIGAKNSPMQMLLSKDSLSFMDGGHVVAYFSNQSFYINRGAVVESLQVGVHKLTKVGNEHTVIQYIPQ